MDLMYRNPKFHRPYDVCSMCGEVCSNKIIGSSVSRTQTRVPCTVHVRRYVPHE
ncbi:MAG: hypothetical protein HW386_2495 [Gammaproteobacteria bacterium]|nr:hypothetical protein [Gammaproteobacteria bacterium]